VEDSGGTVPSCGEAVSVNATVLQTLRFCATWGKRDWRLVRVAEAENVWDRVQR
jgi:hypothetical protein